MKHWVSCRFDYQGCGLSTGDLRQLNLSDWKSDMLTVLDELTAGPQVLFAVQFFLFSNALSVWYVFRLKIIIIPEGATVKCLKKLTCCNIVTCVSSVYHVQFTRDSRVRLADYCGVKHGRTTHATRCTRATLQGQGTCGRFDRRWHAWALPIETGKIALWPASLFLHSL